MGNRLDGLCVSRATPLFIPPNTEHKTYVYDYTQHGSNVGFTKGLGAEKCGIDGFQIKSQASEKFSPKVYTVKEYRPTPAQLRLCVSGRVHVKCEKPSEDNRRSSSQEPFCAFAVCTRGKAVWETLKRGGMRYMHTGVVRSSGVVFALYLISTPSGVFLCPRIMLVLEGGDELVTVDDHLGPVRIPQSFYMDFAVVDEGGRNVQFDVIFRGAGAVEGRDMRTLRTCLQDFATFNNQIDCDVSIGYSAINAQLPGSAVCLQNLVISEQLLECPVQQDPQPYDLWKEAAHMPEKKSSSKILFEGEDARAASDALEVPPHPQLAKAATSDGPSGPKLSGARSSELLAESSVDEFWHHIRYDERGGEEDKSGLRGAHIRGEFWLTKKAIPKKDVYFHCSSTLAQALSMCIAFRFSCPTDYLSLITERAAKVLRHTHIPTNGVIFGVEHFPRHDSLLRMFIEHRNEIKEDMVICECEADSLAGTIVHQEVYDGGTTIMYRVIIIHTDGTRQSAVLQVPAEPFEELYDSARNGSQYQLVEDPSPRFPISPCLVRHDLSPVNRIFVYSNMSYDEDAVDDAFAAEEFQSLPGDNSDRGLNSPEAVYRACDSTSEANYESAEEGEGHYSDNDGLGNLVSSRSQEAGKPASGKMTPNDLGVKWRRPLIQSAVLLTPMEEPPFKCLPSNLG